ncbi:hypothetical protein [Stenotrophomonas maltophilia]|uniref:hypothetical protein n=1 Tax=Stenotrophomonas maltophilia TaxID=40324 RepID=UPI0039C2E87A
MEAVNPARAVNTDHDALVAQLRQELAENEAVIRVWRGRAERAEAEIELLRAHDAALELDATRWRHARRILPVCSIEESQQDWRASGRSDEEEHNQRADAAIDVAIAATGHVAESERKRASASASNSAGASVIRELAKRGYPIAWVWVKAEGGYGLTMDGDLASQAAGSGADVIPLHGQLQLPKHPSGEESDLATSEGGRHFLAEYFKRVIGRHDFDDYISDEVAADFACALAAHLSSHAPKPSVGMVEVVKQLNSIVTNARSHHRKAVQSALYALLPTVKSALDAQQLQVAP